MKKLLSVFTLKVYQTRKFLHKGSGVIPVLVIIIGLISIFFITRGITPHTSELAYIEHSSLGKDAGSVVPASCDSGSPFSSPTSQGGTAGSHFYRDCVTSCPNGGGNYDPYFDSGMSACPAPVAWLDVTPNVIPYMANTNLSWGSAYASDCYFYYNGGNTGWHGTSLSSTVWGPHAAQVTTLDIGCYGNNKSTWDTKYLYVQPDVPTVNPAVCTNPQGNNATISWNAPAGVTAAGYYLRIQFPGGQSCPAGWQTNGVVCYPNPDTFTSTSYNFTVIPGQTYNWWTYARNDYTYSNPGSQSFSCAQTTGSVSLSATSCTIATGASSCNVNATWSTSNPYSGNVSVISRNKPVRNDYMANSGGPSPVAIYGPPATSLTTISLVNSGLTLDSKTASASCAAGGWDSIGGQCADPNGSSYITGNYYTPAVFHFTCNLSNGYKVRNTSTNTLITQVTNGSYVSGTPTDVSISTAGDYQVECMHGDWGTLVAPNNFSVTPPLATISLVSSPRSISKNSQSSLSWTIKYPLASCTFTATAVCTNGQCTAAQTTAEAALNAQIAAQTTDASDPAGASRSIMTAIRTFAPGRAVDYLAIGKKTFTISNTTDFKIQCGAASANARVLVTKSNEQ